MTASGGSSSLAAFTGFLLGAGTMLVCGYLYQTEIVSRRQGKKDKQFLPKILGGAHASSSSSGGFLTDMIGAMWNHLNKAISAEIQATVEPMFVEMLPGPLKTLHFTKVDLGHVPLRLDNCIVHECAKHSMTGQEYVQFEVDCVWDGNCDIQLQADYFGSFGVKSMKLAGRMAILMQPMTTTIPCIGAVQYGFINVPELHLEFTGLAAIADMKSMYASIHKMMIEIISDMMVLPNRMMTKLDDASSYFAAHQPPLGIARITVVSGRGFVEEVRTMRANDVPDVYCKLSVGASKLYSTSVIKNDVNPVWKNNNTSDFILCHYDQVLRIEAWDEDNGTMDPDDPLGNAEMTIGDIVLSGRQPVELELLDDDNVPNGGFVTVQCDILPLTTSVPKALPKAISAAAENTICGLLTIHIAQLIDLPPAPVSDSKAPPTFYFVKAVCGSKHEFFTGVIDATFPSLDCSFRVPLTAQDLGASNKNYVTLTLVQGEVAADDDKNNTVIGSFDVPYDTIANANGQVLLERRKIVDDNGPSLEYSIVLCGVSAEKAKKPGNLRGSSGKQPTSSLIGTSSPGATTSENAVEITIVKGHGFVIEKRKFGKDDVPDVFCKVKFGSNPTVWRTKTVKNSCKPVWGENECKTFTMKDHSQIISIHAFDEDSGANDPDDDLGTARISVGKLLLSGGSHDVELLLNGQGTGAFITVQCNMLGGSADAAAEGATIATTKQLDDSQGGGSSSEASNSDPEAVLVEKPTKAVSAAVKQPAKGEATVAKKDAKSSNNKKAAAATKKPTTETTRAGPKQLLITAVKGSGFMVEKKLVGKDDVPDVYCKIQLGKTVWKTKTIKNNLSPEWNETKKVKASLSENQILCVDVYDEDTGIGDSDDFLGKFSVPIGELLSAKEQQFELKTKKGKPTGCFVTFRCEEETSQ